MAQGIDGIGGICDIGVSVTYTFGEVDENSNLILFSI
jgi:hypothetical protein